MSLFFLAQMTFGFVGFVATLLSLITTVVFGVSASHTVGVQTFLYLKGVVPMTIRDVYLNTLILGGAGLFVIASFVGAVFTYFMMSTGYTSLSQSFYDNLSAVQKLCTTSPSLYTYVINTNNNDPETVCCCPPQKCDNINTKNDPLAKLWDVDSDLGKNENNESIKDDDSFQF